MNHEQHPYMAENLTHANIVKLSDVEPITVRERTSGEAGYRRGYVQGYAMALDAIASGFSVEETKAFIYEKLAPWRYHKHGGKFQQPPELT